MERIRGVNLGNWLVLEKWMDGRPFAGTVVEDETWLSRDLEGPKLQERLKEHRETFITEEDFRRISNYGLNTVRIPVPYFIFGDREPFVGCIEYLDRAFEWAVKYGMKIIIDLHTAPLGQNGYDNGGILGVCKFHKNPEEVSYVLTVLERLAKRYALQKPLLGIEVLNEPIGKLAYITSPTKNGARDKREAYGSSGIPLSFLRQFYIDAYKRMRKYLPLSKAIIFHDSFRLDSWGDFFVKNGMINVYLDAHFYLSAMEGFIPFHNKALMSVINKLNPLKLVDKLVRIKAVKSGSSHLANVPGEGDLFSDSVEEVGRVACRGVSSNKKKCKNSDSSDFMQATSNILPYSNMLYHRMYIAIEKLRIKRASKYTPLIVGEWCISVSYANDTIYTYRDTVNKILGTNYSEETFARKAQHDRSIQRLINKEKRRRYRQIEKLQMSAWNLAAGNIYWSYKIAQDTDTPSNMHWKSAWDYRRCKKRGWVE